MGALDKFNKMLGAMASQAGMAISTNPKVRSLFLKRGERAAYEYIIEENEDHRPVAVAPFYLLTDSGSWITL